MDNQHDIILIYQIKVKGNLSEGWEAWLYDTEIATNLDHDGNPITILTGRVIDQVALRGLLNIIWDLNLELISIQKVESSSENEGEKA